MISIGRSSLDAQDHNNLRSTLLYYVADMVIWPDSLIQDTSFHIHLYKVKPELKEEIKSLSRFRKVQGLTVIITEGPLKFSGTSRPQVVYMQEALENEIKQFHINYGLEPILAITDHFDDKLFTMINFIKLETPSRIGYEINAPNMLVAKLDYRDELLQYGQAAFTIKEFYQRYQKGFDIQNKAIDSLNALIIASEKKNELLNSQVTLLEDNIQHKNNLLSQLDDSLNYQQNVLDIHRELLLDYQEKLIQSQNLFDSSQKNYESLLAQQSSLRDSISTKENDLLYLDEQIAERESIIRSQLNEMKEQETLISTQNKTLYSLTGLGFSVFVIAVLMYRANQSKSRYNAKLMSINEKMEATNEELSTSNDQLARQKNELELALQQLNDTQKMLIQSEKLASLGIFTAGVAHELNNPINYISAGNEALNDAIHQIKSHHLVSKEPALSEELVIVETLQQSIQKGVERASAIVSSLRNYSHSDGEEFKNYDIVQCIEDSLTMLQNVLKYHIKLHLDLPEELFIECIPGKLNQVFINLINNAAHAIDQDRKDGQINITAKKISSDMVDITCTDNGFGIKKEYLPKLFDPFFTTKEVGKGTGLGLYIVHGIIVKHNGEVHVDSTEGKGSTFRLRLPVKQPILSA